VAVAAAVAAHLPTPLGSRLLRVAQDAYVLGMSDVLLITAGMMLVGAALMAAFMPAHARKVETVPVMEAPQPAGVAS
jgi:hypothetical protein